MVDRERLLAKIDELDGYLGEIRKIMPADFRDFLKIEKRRACERLLQISIEGVIDICGLVVKGFRLGLPAEENDLFELLAKKNLITPAMKNKLRAMRGFRNIIVHEYGRVDEKIVYEMLTKRLKDFSEFKRQILKTVRFIKK
ncbi:MAG: DUF86 domain-containing protein [Candidatus Aminicenantes bacterium]|nr:DUF86 domain-containing protein [Candidatus Aminicenantes bacterium]